MNSVSVIGRLTLDPELHLNADGRPMATLQVAVDDRRNGGTSTVVVTVVAYDARAHTVARYLRRGRLIGVQGRLAEVTGSNQHRRWHKHHIVAFSVDFLDDRPDPSQSETAGAQADGQRSP